MLSNNYKSYSQFCQTFVGYLIVNYCILKIKDKISFNYFTFNIAYLAWDPSHYGIMQTLAMLSKI